MTGAKRGILWSAIACTALAAPLAAAGSDTVIGHVVTRDYELSIHSTPVGLRYSVRDAEGRSLATRLTSQALLAAYPDAHRTLVTGVAELPGAIVWAGR